MVSTRSLVTLQAHSVSFPRRVTILERADAKRSSLWGRRAFGFFIGMLLVLLLGELPEASAQISRVNITIDSITNKGCFDQWIWCNKPDMMVRVGLKQVDGSIVSCPDTTPSVNKNTVLGPMAACSGIKVETPFAVVVSIFDVEESKLPAVAEIQQKFKLSTDPNSMATRCFRGRLWKAVGR